MLNAGEKFGRYKIQRLLGVGGMGEVYKAEDSALERSLALKILSPDLLEDSEQVRRFSLEAKAISALNHPNILTIYEIGEANGLKYIASEFVKGKTLTTIIKREKLSLSKILDLAVQIISAINTAHTAGIIHRDIKPDNLMVRDDNLVKVLDFGLAKLIEKINQTNPITLEGAVMGTPHYMSPEQAEGKEIDARTDLWSFGVVLYEMLTGEKAFGGETVAEIVVSLMLKEPRGINELKHKFPAELDEIVRLLLQKNRDERFQKASDVLNGLSHLKTRRELEKEFNVSETELPDKEPKNHPPDIPNNLGNFSVELIGRKKEVKEISELLKDENIRLVTLTGIGGTGKTTLSQAVARKVLDNFPDGVFFIELAAVNDPELVPAAVAQTLNIAESGGKSIIENLQAHLQNKKILLILDNFEQVTNAKSFVSEILKFSAKLKVLVTSRELLRLSVEHGFYVQPLELPSESKADEELLENEAVRLFIERTKKVKPNFTLNEENLRNAAGICLRLEGLPLAIEFAAARCRLLSPSAILSKLENRLQLLSGGSPDLPARRQTMRGAIEWSYDLLEAAEKALFRRLAVFSGGFTVQSAESVINLEQDKLKPDVLDGIASLLDKSLIFSKENDSGEPRFQMLEIVREYAFEVLKANNETAETRKNHAGYFLALGEKAEKHLHGEDSAKWLNLLETENDNLRLALQWLLDNDPENGIKLISAIRYFWLLRTYLTEGTAWIDKALGQGLFISADIRFNLLNALGWLYIMQSHYKTARKIFEELLVLSKSGNDSEKIARANRGLANTMQYLGDFEAARKLSEEELEISRQLNDKNLIGNSLNSLGNLALLRDDLKNARLHFEECLLIAEELNSKVLIHSSLINLGTVSFYQSKFREAEAFYTKSLELSQELGNKIVISYCLDGLAALAVENGDLEKAARLAGAAETVRRTISVELELIERKFRDAYLEKLRRELIEGEFEKNYGIGSELDLDEAIALALP